MFCSSILSRPSFSVNTGAHSIYISFLFLLLLLCDQFSQQVSEEPLHFHRSRRTLAASARSALMLKLCEGRENKTHELAVTGDTRLTAVFMERGLSCWSPKDSLNPENGSHDLPRCSLRLDSLHVVIPYKSSRSLISNTFHSLSGMAKFLISEVWVPTKGWTKSRSLCVVNADCVRVK